MNNHTITPEVLTQKTLSQKVHSSIKGTIGATAATKDLLLITDAKTMRAVWQVRHNGTHVITTKHAEMACAAYNAIQL